LEQKRSQSQQSIKDQRVRREEEYWAQEKRD
jgi:hypothetical protein